MPDDWSDSDDDALVETNVLLGVPDGPISESTDLADAAVSRIGGHPAFLPKQAPPLDDAKCSECAAQMELVLQIWCPFQDSPMDRALYVWACPMPRCQGKHGSVRAFRGLRFNATYAAKLARKKQREAERAKATADAAKPPPKPQHNPFSLGAQGQLAPNLFAPPPAPETQCGADKHDGAPESDSDSDTDSEASLVLALASTTIKDTPWHTTPAYPALYLSTEEEYAPAPSNRRKPTQDALANTDDLDPSAWSAEKYEDSLDTDKVFDRFSQRVAWRGEQCVRYELGGTPLPYANDKLFSLLWPKQVYNPSAVPKCPACQTARVFECQLMPNLISVIAPAAPAPTNEEERRAAVAAALKRETKGIDWGTALIFSCPNDDCRGEWKEEVVYVWTDTV